LPQKPFEGTLRKHRFLDCILSVIHSLAINIVGASKIICIGSLSLTKYDIKTRDLITLWGFSDQKQIKVLPFTLTNLLLWPLISALFS
jgi:hypothetical protein